MWTLEDRKNWFLFFQSLNFFFISHSIVSFWRYFKIEKAKMIHQLGSLYNGEYT